MLKITLQGVGNPDFSQWADVAPERTINVETIEEAAKEASAYIDEYDLGGGNWTDPYVLNEQGEKVARIFYNGRIALPGDEYFNL